MENIEKLKQVSQSIKRINQKLRLLKLLNLAKEEYEKNNYEDCVEACLKILESNPKNPIALRGLGCAMQSMCQPEKAVEYYLEALNYSDNKEIEYTLLGTIYYIQNNFDEALKYYNLAIEINDDYEPAYGGRNQTILERHLQLIDLQDELIEKELRKLI